MARKKRSRQFSSEAPEPAEAVEAAVAVEDQECSELESILHLDPNGLLVVDAETRQVWWANRTAEKLLRKKPDQLLAEPFPDDLNEGLMDGFDVTKRSHRVKWQGNAALLLTLIPVQSGSASFSLEWRLEAAEERARDAEEQVSLLQAQLKELRKQSKENKGENGSSQALRDRERELQAELERREERLQAHEQELRELTARVERAEERAREAENLMEGAESQAQEAERHLEDLSDTVRQLEEQLEAARQGTGTQSEAGERQGEVDQLLAKITEFQEKQQEWAQRESEVEELELVHLQVMTELEQLRQEKQHWEESAASAQSETSPAELDTLRERLQETQERLDFLEIDRAELEEKLIEARAQNDILQSLQQELDDARQDVESAKARVRDEADLRHLAETQREQLERNLAELEELLQDESRTKGDQEQAQLTWMAERAELERLLEESRQHTAAVEERVNAASAELEGLRGQISEAENRDEKHLDTELQLQHDFEDLQQHVAQVQKERDDLMRRLDDAEQQIEAIERKYTEKAAEAEAESSALLDLETQLAELQDRLSQRESQEPAIEAEMQSSREQLEALRNQVKVGENQARLLQEQLDELTEQLEASIPLEAELLKLRPRLTSLEDERVQLESQLQQLQERTGHVAELEAELETLRVQAAQAEQMKSELDHFSQQVAESARLSGELEQVRQQAAQAGQLEQELSVLREQVADSQRLMEELESLRAQASGSAELSAELDNARSRLQESTQLIQELEQLRQQADLSSRRIGELEQESRQAHELAAELQKLRADAAALQEQLQGSQVLATRVPQLESELHAALERAKEIAASSADQARIAELEAQVIVLQAVQNSHDASKARIAELEGQLAAAAQQAVAAPSASGGLPASAASVTEQLAFEDNLTHLPNMNLLRRYLDFSLKQVDRYQRRCALIHVDLDRFQALKEALGAAGGDEVLIQVAQRLQTVVRTSDVLCRKHEDDFLILLSEIAGDEGSSESISIVLRRIQEVLGPPLQAANQPVLISASIGVSQFPSDAQDGDQMLLHAAAAMRRAKELGRNQVQFYTEDLQKRHEARATLEAELRKGLEQRQFTLLYQPIVHLPTGRVAGVESLLRWNHPTYGPLTPEYFLEVADETGLLNPIGRWGIQEAARQLYEWARQGLDIFVTVNLSTRQFLQADLVETIRRAIETTGAPAHNFVVEIPESVQMLDIQRVQGILLALRQAGVRVALDRFGSGFSSLERLHSELITLLKVDRKFLFHASTNAAALNVTVAALGLARGLRLRPVAVGVENEGQLTLCRQLECEYVQGNLVYVPTEAQQVSELARAGRLLR